MTEQETALDLPALLEAVEGNDAEALIGFYAEDAEVITVNRNAPPSSPSVLRGAEIGAYLRDVCTRDIAHRVEDEVVGGDRIAFREACEYPDGTRVLAATTLHIREGRIQRQVSVEAWDE